MSSRMKLSDEEVDAFVETHQGWTRNGETIVRSFKFADYSSALGFVVRVALEAEKRDHHPEIQLTWGRAEVTWSTHDADGITTLDTTLAECTDKLYESQRM